MLSFFFFANHVIWITKLQFICLKFYLKKKKPVFKKMDFIDSKNKKKKMDFIEVTH